MPANNFNAEETSDLPHLIFGPELLRNPDESLRREWLVTNGLGGYASSSLATANTRRYHGLLVAALNPPCGRAVLLSKLEETLTVTGAQGTETAYALSANVYPGAIYPKGYETLEVWLTLPSLMWRWELAPGLCVEKFLWMTQGQNTTYIAYRLRETPDNQTVRLSLVPLLAWRDYHSEMAACEYRPEAVWNDSCLQLLLPPIERVTASTTTLQIHLQDNNQSPFPNVHFEAHPDWYYHIQHPREQERGQDFQEDLYTPGTLSLSLTTGELLVVIATTEHALAPPPPRSSTSGVYSFGGYLARAAAQFIVQVPGGRSTIIAGYPWFGDWGRDTMISLPGLCLTTGQEEIARDILLSFAQYVDQGMLPNRFPDVGETPEYNTVDATLWYFVAIYRYVEATGDKALLTGGLWETLKDIIQWHQQGTRYNIHVDPADNLLHAGQEGVQLTWMDAKCGEWVVTPRMGKPVEINALWYNALRIMAHFAGLLNDSSADSYTQQAQRMQTSFVSRFARPDEQGLYDVLDTPPSGKVDASIRPNQIFALSLPFPAVELDTPLASAIIAVVREELLTPRGLRTLSPRDSDFKPRYEGNALHRDGAYHQGTVWPWLLGPYAEAYYKVTCDAEGAKQMLSGLQTQMITYGIGSLAEVFDATEPQRPNGCYAQAWSVAETLRVWQWLATLSIGGDVHAATA